MHTGAEGDVLGLIERRQEAIDALLGVLNDIGGGQRDNYNVSYEAAGKALDATGLLADDRGAVAALRKYGWHDGVCPATLVDDPGPCECGWDDAATTYLGGQS